LVNTPGCLSLSIGGCVSVASHGTGFDATIANTVQSLTIILWDGSVKHIKKDSPEFKVICGGFGSCGIIITITLKTIPIFFSQEIHHTVIKMPDAISKIMKSIHSPNCWDHIYWIPVVDDYYYFERTADVKNELIASNNNTTGVLFGVSNFFSPIGAKGVDGSRTANIISAHTAFSTLSKVYGLSLTQLPTQNSNFRLQLPVSELAISLRPHFEMQLDCEVFFPAQPTQTNNKSFTTALKFLNTVYRVVLGDIDLIKSENLLNEIGDQNVFDILEHNKLWKELHDCVDKKALFGSPVMIRYVPGTKSALLAPNYGQDMFAVSMAWFGTKENAHKYKKVMTFIIKNSMKVFDAKFHFGKFSPIPDLVEENNIKELHEYQKYYAREIATCQRVINQMDPNSIFQNSFTKAWFKLESMF
jgi:hypothetical protein